MAEKNTDKKIPYLSGRVWWTLRQKFLQRLPAIVDAAYLSTTLQAKESSTRVYIPMLKAMGLIDAKGKPTDLANHWRDDKLYKETCETIIENVVPKDLQDACPPPKPDRADIEHWFRISAGVGESAAGAMASFYLLLCHADPSQQSKATTPKTTERARAPSRRQTSKTTTSQEKPKNTATSHSGTSDGGSKPTVNIKLDINISPEASAEQIDSIFASIARHLNVKPNE